MKNKLFSILMLVAALLITNSAFGQSITTTTTLSAAISDRTTTRFTVGSATGFVASTGALDYYAYIDREAIRITAVSSTTITGQRAQLRTSASAHKSGAVVYVGVGGPSPTGTNTAGGPFVQSAPSGACTRAGIGTLPQINVTDGQLYNCWNGQWYRQNPIDDISSGQQRFCNVNNSGIAALTSLGVSTTAAAGTVYVTSINVPTSRRITGVSVLNGGTIGTSLTVAALYDAAGNLLANSNTAGISGGTASTFWDIALTATYLVTGPAKYHIGVQAQGATSTFQLLGAGAAFGDIFGNLRAGTLGTLPAITIPTAFTSVQAPVVCLY